jgi:hypothetical protein
MTVQALLSPAGLGQDRIMGRRLPVFRISAFIFSLLMAFALAPPRAVAGGPSAAATAAFDKYVRQVESRLAQQHRSTATFLVPEDWARLRRGEQIIEEVQRPGGSDLPGAMLHHWRGTAFAPGATAADFERLMKNFAGYPTLYSPQVLVARVNAHQDDHFQVTMRIRQKHVITVVMDATYDVTFGRLDPQHGYSLSRSTRISEIESPGTRNERALGPDQGHGFLWRLNTYWSYEERDGGLYMQIESVSLSRSVPTGLGWAVKPFVESVPRESLEFTLRATCNALHQ